MPGITNNTDMTTIVDWNMTTMEHRTPLEDRMFQFFLGKRLNNDFGKISKVEIREFFKWLELNTIPVPQMFKVPMVTSSRGVYKEESEPLFIHHC